MDEQGDAGANEWGKGVAGRGGERGGSGQGAERRGEGGGER